MRINVTGGAVGARTACMGQHVRHDRKAAQAIEACGTVLCQHHCRTGAVVVTKVARRAWVTLASRATAVGTSRTGRGRRHSQGRTLGPGGTVYALR